MTSEYSDFGAGRVRHDLDALRRRATRKSESGKDENGCLLDKSELHDVFLRFEVLGFLRVSKSL